MSAVLDGLLWVAELVFAVAVGLTFWLTVAAIFDVWDTHRRATMPCKGKGGKKR